MSNADWEKMIYDQAFYNAERELTRLVALLDSTKQRIEKKIEYMKANGDARPSDYFNWAINDVENLVRNVNYSTLARIQAQFSRVCEK